ncbi:MAG TPA: VOC family protein [Acetobacteraceae bacterium]|nr:VOC family protein [Acetobacteraceae bacterium]
MAAIHARLTHMGLYAQDLERMIGFYTEVLGLIVADRGPGRAPGTEMAFMTGDPACHHQVVLVSGRPETEGYNPINQISFTVGSLAELRAVRDRALSRGATALRQVNHGNAWSIYFRDPEGNTLEAYLDTPFHVPQPRGDALDLDQPDAAILAATEAACRADPGFLSRADYTRQVAARLA